MLFLTCPHTTLARCESSMCVVEMSYESLLHCHLGVWRCVNTSLLLIRSYASTFRFKWSLGSHLYLLDMSRKLIFHIWAGGYKACWPWIDSCMGLVAVRLVGPESLFCLGLVALRLVGPEFACAWGWWPCGLLVPDLTAVIVLRLLWPCVSKQMVLHSLICQSLSERNNKYV